MKKITVVVQAKDIEGTLKELGKTGVLHIEHQIAPKSESLSRLKEEHHALSKAIEALPHVEGQETLKKRHRDIVSEILRLIDKKEILLENLKKMNKDVDSWREWGDFDPELIDDLKNRNIWIRLCRITKKEAQNLPEAVILEEIFRKGSVLYCAVISRKEIPLPFHTLSLPQKGLKEILASQEEEKAKIVKIERDLSELAKYKNDLISHRKELTSLIEFNEVRDGMGKFEKLSYLRGYCPVYNVSLLEKIAHEEKWGVIIEDPDEKDSVPTLIKNPRWVEIIKPVFQMIKTIPGYREVDTSLWFLLFFSVFFGMLIGDAGYGAVFFLISLLCHIKFKEKVEDKSIFFLTYILSVCAMVWGMLTGTFFGQAWLPQRVEPLMPYLRENVNVQGLCFFIGAVHLSIAHIWRFIRKLPSLKAFSEAGWICMLWLATFLARSLILGYSFPEQGKWLFLASAGLIILFTNPRKNVLKMVGSGIGEFLLHIVNSFTDVVSYIRLFAVGAATVAVADAFNQMAGSIGSSNIFMGFLTAVVLLFGHTLNILLAAMAILVHGIRLNVLEFSSHLNMEWTGVEYRPFGEKH